jgi:hypothetical protein
MVLSEHRYPLSGHVFRHALVGYLSTLECLPRQGQSHLDYSYLQDPLYTGLCDCHYRSLFEIQSIPSPKP